MAAISQSIPTLLGGVSQQPDPIKLPGQVRKADNVYLDPTFGCVKRPPTRYVAALGDNNIPENAKWFPIFRDNNERYLACCYEDQTKSPKTRFRVWEADSGIERNVQYGDNVGNYINPGNFRRLEFLTINDYTFIVNPSVQVSMSSGGRVPQKKNEALIVINQIGYNTTYAVDLLKEDEDLQQTEETRATEIGVSPGSWEDDDQDGSCGASGVQEYTESNGLRYRLTVNCQPTQVTEYKEGQTYPTQVALQNTSERQFADWAAIQFGNPKEVAPNSYAYTTINMTMDGKDIGLRVEGRAVKICKYGETSEGSAKNRMFWSFSSADVISYQNAADNNKKPWAIGNDGKTKVTAGADVGAGYSADGLDVCNDNGKVLSAGTDREIEFEVVAIDKGPKTPEYSYKSVYSASVQLLNGGVGPKKGDIYEQTFKGKLYKIRVRDIEKTYVYKSDASVSFTTPSDITGGPLDVASIAGALVTQINALDGWEAEVTGNVIKVVKTNGTSFNISARGGSTENAMYGIKNVVNDISKLPTVGFDGVVLKVMNSVDTEADDYYVEFVTTDGIPGAGSWSETAKPGIQTSLNASTMPHALKRKPNGNFKIISLEGTDDEDPIAWANRTVGDDDTNPIPTFVGKALNNMVFHMNRFGFLSEDTVTLSQAGDYFNFFVGSAIAVSDADPIDMAATSTRPANLKAGISTASGLILFSTDAQFLMDTRDVAFGPSTVQINEVSNYAYRSEVNPIEVGTSIFFASNSTNFSKVFEMSIESIGSTPQVAEDTRIVPEYVPKGLMWAAASSNNNLALMGTGQRNVYCFKYWNQGKERALAGWFRWKFDFDIKLIEFYDDVAYLIMRNELTGAYIISTMNLMDDPDVATIWSDDRSFEPRLDVYAPSEDLAIKDGPTVDGQPTRKIRLPDGAYYGQDLAYLQFTKSRGTFFSAFPIVDRVDGTAWVRVPLTVLEASNDFNLGMTYTMEVELPGFYAKSDEKVDRVNIPMIETVNIELYLSGSYTVSLEKLGYEDRILYFDAKEADVYLADKNPIVETSKKELHVFSRGDHASVTIVSEDPLPAGITGYTWEGHYSTRGITRI
jgi:hypothetical protein